MKRYRLKAKTQNNSRQPFFTQRKERKSKRKLFFSVIIAGALIYSLLTWLLPALIGSLTVINQFKPTPVQPTPVADEITLAPPVLNIPFEATNTATIKIKGYSTPDLSVKIYVDDNLKNTAKTSADGSFTSDSITLSLGTNNIYGQTVDENNHQSLPSKIIRVTYNNEKPTLDLDSPSDNQEIKGGDKKITVSGKVTPSGGTAITVNGTRVIVKEDGNFSQTIDINEGENNIVIIATSQTGNSTQVTRQVIYSPASQ